MARPRNRDNVIPPQRDDSPAVYPLGSHSAAGRRQPASIRTTDAVFGASTGPGSVISTLELSRRPTRPPDHESENRALVALVEAMTAASSNRILQTLVETARDLCRAHSAGLSLLEEDHKHFRWPAIAGEWAPHLGGGTPRHFGPCGTVLDCGVALLFSHPERDFPYLAAVTPCIDEGLLIPFAVNGETVGTIWIVSHDQSRRFDAEDLRVLTNLAKFAAAAYQTRLSMNALEKANEELRQTASALTNANSLTKKLSQEKLHLQGALLAESAANDKRERELELLRASIARQTAAQHFIAVSARMQDVLELAGQVAPLDTTVLVYGESGTGKEFVVKMIHDQSPRAKGPFVSVNCAALTETLLESELFGHVRGAFTGAVRDKAGLFEVAGDGTLFLDEIGEVAPTVQAKLLRALQEREIRRVGAERTIKVNARVVAATNRDLRAAVAAGTFREDLYFRLGVFVITMPPLRERREAIPPLVHDFIRRAAVRVKKDVQTVSAEAMTALVSYHWPGNVRELEHAIERAVIVARGTSVETRDLPPEVFQKPDHGDTEDSLDLQAQERAMIARALERFRGNRRQAADALKISTVTLWRKMKHYELVE
jgi:transcriptional regulator with PAS, ATPase and Fis domain